MNNIFVYCEIEGGKVADVSLELLTKGRALADTLGCELEALALGQGLAGVEKQLAEYGADVVHVADCECLAPYRTLPHAAVVCGIFKEEQPQIALFGATPVGRDLGPRVSSALHSGLTADCTSLEIGPHTENKTGKVYENLLYQIRPAFGGNIIATIINPDHRPQMATVREGVMKKEKARTPGKGVVRQVDAKKYLSDADFAVRIIDRQIEERKIDIKGAPVIVAGGYGMGSKENFDGRRARGRGRRLARGGRCRHGRPCAPDRTNGRHRAAEALHSLRHFGPDPAYGRHGRFGDGHLDQHRPGRSDQQDSRLCHYGRRDGGDSEDDQVL